MNLSTKDVTLSALLNVELRSRMKPRTVGVDPVVGTALTVANEWVADVCADSGAASVEVTGDEASGLCGSAVSSTVYVGQCLSGSRSHSGPCHHRLLLFRSAVVSIRVARSAGLSSEATYRNC